MSLYGKTKSTAESTKKFRTAYHKKPAEDLSRLKPNDDSPSIGIREEAVDAVHKARQRKQYLILSFVLITAVTGTAAYMYFGNASYGSIVAKLNKPLKQYSKLYTNNSVNCKTVEVKKWTHPTANVLRENGLMISKLEMCKQGKYPIFFISEPTPDPRMGYSNAQFYTKLMVKLFAANGTWPFALVLVDDNYIFQVTGGNNDEVEIDEDDYEQE